jgi:hypothetical protein
MFVVKIRILALSELRDNRLPYQVQAGDVGWVNRPRLHWLSWDVADTLENKFRRESTVNYVEFLEKKLPRLEKFLDHGTRWLGSELAHCCKVDRA